MIQKLQASGGNTGNANAVLNTAFLASIYDKHATVTNYILAQTDVSANAQGPLTGNAPLLWAAVWCNSAAATTLLAQGADFSLVNKEGETALAVAMRVGCPTVAAVLRAAGART